MGLGVSLNIATSGLQGVETMLDTVSKNVSNASTDGYVSESANIVSVVVGRNNSGVRAGHNSLSYSPALMSSLYTQNGKVSNLSTMTNSLSNVSMIQGTTGADSDGNSDTMGSLSDYLGKLKTSLINVTNAPTNGSSQYNVISNAQTLVSNIHTLATTYQTQRQNAQDAVVEAIPGINTDLTTIGSLSKKIMVAKASGDDTSDLENQRLGFMDDLSERIGISFTEKSNGDMIVTTEDGAQLPTRPDQIGLDDNTQTVPTSDWPLSTKKTILSPEMYHSEDSSKGGIPAIMLNGRDVTSHLTNGSLGANITLRDQTYPKMQAQLDSFASTLINRFDAAGMPLFTPSSKAALDPNTHSVLLDANNNVLGTDGKALTVNGGSYLKADPADSTGTKFVTIAKATDPASSGQKGVTIEASGHVNGATVDMVDLASKLEVSSDYVTNPALVTTSANGSIGDITTVNNVLNKTFSNDIDNISGNLAAPSEALGPNGSFTTGYPGTESLDKLATDLTSTQAQVINAAKTGLSSETSIQTNLTTQVNSISGVNVNNQMAMIVTLQNSYSANAKVVSAVQTMFNALINAV